MKVQVVQLQLALGPFCFFCLSFYLNSYLQVLMTLLVGYLQSMSKRGKEIFSDRQMPSIVFTKYMCTSKGIEGLMYFIFNTTNHSLNL